MAGIPLALELAAARLQSMSPDEMARRMDDQFELLTTGSRAAEPRQRTLESTMDWSYRLLTDDEQALLRRAALFRGGFRLEAAEAVAIGELVPASRVADLLGRLVEASLVTAEIRGDATIYSMLEPVRQYGLRLLDDVGDSEATRDRRFAVVYSSGRVRPLPIGPLVHVRRSGGHRQRLPEALSSTEKQARATPRFNWRQTVPSGRWPLGRPKATQVGLSLWKLPSRRPTRIGSGCDHCARCAIGIGRPPIAGSTTSRAGEARTAGMFGQQQEPRVSSRLPAETSTPPTMLARPINVTSGRPTGSSGCIAGRVPNPDRAF